MTIPPDKLIELYEKMVAIRLFEETAGRLSTQGRIPGALHLYVGEEAVAAGVCACLNVDDYITSTHRGHGHLVAKGGDFGLMFAELFGKATGYCKGKGGSMHIASLDLGMLGANGIVGGGAPIAVGAAWTCKQRGRGQVAVCFFGDGASNEGSLHEAMNMAALYRLPVIFCCENNLYGEYTPQHKHQTVADVADRAAAYNFPGVVVDGMDAIAVYEAASEAIGRARAGGGPTLLECKTYRYYDHVGVRPTATYRTDEEVERWKARDPIAMLGARLLEMGVLDETGRQAIHDRIEAKIAEGLKFAEESPLPDPADVLADVYA